MVICFAAGQRRHRHERRRHHRRESIGSQSAAKNCITVGASESDRPDFAADIRHILAGRLPRRPHQRRPQAEQPRRDGRLQQPRPDQGRAASSRTSWPRARASCPRCLAEWLPLRTDFGMSSDPLFFFSSGTSMATPARRRLRGGAARDPGQERPRRRPSAALIKALLINGAVRARRASTPRARPGQSPNNNSGFGRVDLAGSVIIPGPTRQCRVRRRRPAGKGQEGRLHPRHSREVRRAATRPGRPVMPSAADVTLKITLVWTDPPGPRSRTTST